MNDFIYNQHDIPKEQYRYGLRASADVGCGWVATWNALQVLGYKTDIPALIRYYEWQLPLIHGNTGTSFWGPAVCFRKWGFPVKIVVDTKRFDEAAKNADACILFYHWRNKYRFGAHFVALRNTAGGFVGYNTYRNSTGADNYGGEPCGFPPQTQVFWRRPAGHQPKMSRTTSAKRRKNQRKFVNISQSTPNVPWDFPFPGNPPLAFSGKV